MRIVMVAAFVAVGLGACTDSDAFCSRGEEIADRIQNDFDPGDATDVRDFADDMRDLAGEAPDEIRGETETVADGLERLAEGDASAASDENFAPALEKFAAYVDEECS
jgi:hypothetical protein